MSACEKCGYEHWDEQTCTEYLMELKALEIASAKILEGKEESTMVEVTGVNGNRKLIEVYMGHDGNVHNRTWYPTGVSI